MESKSHLLTQLVKYDKYSVPFCGNPEITFFSQMRNVSVKSRRHTNFVCGIVPIVSSNGYKFDLTAQTDILQNVIIQIDKSDSFESLQMIRLTIGSCTAVLTPEYIKMYSTICKKIILNSTPGADLLISIPLSSYNYFYSPEEKYQNKSSIYPWETFKIPISITVFGNFKKPVEVKLFGSVLDTEERGKIAKTFETNNNFYDSLAPMYSSLIPIDLIVLEQEIQIIPHINVITWGIELSNGFESLESIEINTGKNKIVLTPNIIQMYNKMYDQIIFGSVIKIRGLINKSLNKNQIYKIKVNTLNKTKSRIFTCIDTANQTKNFIFTINDSFSSFFKEYIFSPGEQIIVNPKSQYHLVSMQIFSDQDINPITSINLQIGDEYSVITDLNDSQLFQQELFCKLDPKYFTICFALIPIELSQPTGEFNVSSSDILKLLAINSNPTKQIHLIISGYQSEDPNL
jgi:hypothetical protein